METANPKLSTRNFTLLTAGSTISMLGNAIAGFSLGLLILDYTKSTFLYALTMVVYNLPKVVMPVLSGPYLDRFSRRKTLYSLDFVSAVLYLLMFFMLQGGFFNYAVMLFVCVLVGSLDSVYQVAYESFYPLLITEGNYSKAYSISSMIYPLSAMMVPVAAHLYERTHNIAPLFLFNAVTFLLAGAAEMMIRADESHLLGSAKAYNLKQYGEDFKAGIGYIRSEKGLLVITAYFFVSTLVSSASGTLLMPYFKSEPNLGVELYTYVMGWSLIGRLIGGSVHYNFKYPTDKKFLIAMGVYLVSSVIEGSYLFLPVAVMMVLNFVSGFICVTSFNIRISSTQNYVPDSLRARFNGSFQMICTLGTILGGLIAGALGEFLPIRGIIVCCYSLCALAAMLIMFRGRRHVKLIYNREF